MSVDIYGRTYKGAQYRELVEYATRLVPKRSQEKSEHPDPFVGHPARRGKPMILEWLKHRSEHGKERQKRGLPPRRPSRTARTHAAVPRPERPPPHARQR